MNSKFFINTINSSVIKVLQSANSSSENKLESDEKLLCTDLICEGPIEGLVDKQGNLLKYITDSNSSQIENIVLGKGVYYNDVPLIDDKINKFNFVTMGFDINYGSEFNNYSYEYPATIHRYNQKIYLNEIGSFEDNLNSIINQTSRNGIFGFFKTNDNGIVNYGSVNGEYLDHPFASALKSKVIADLVAQMDTAKANCQEFNHKIQNKYCDEISVHLRADSLFQTSDGNVILNNVYIGIEISEDNSSNRFYAIVGIEGVSKSGYIFDVPIMLNLDNVNKNSYYVKVFAISKKISPSNGTLFKEISVSSIVEKIKYKGSFSYPFSSIIRSGVSSRHFSQDPTRTFDLKLLKIKVPKNYDPEIREYNGNWNGSFDSFLRWTDNPAWIYYDLCTNTRYGIGNGYISEKDLNKWELYKISKYCDELVKVSTPAAYSEDKFFLSKINKNCIYISKTSEDANSRTLTDFRRQYPPVLGNVSFANANGGFNNSIIYLYNLINDNGKIDSNYKKIIWSVDEISVDDAGNEIVVAEGSGNIFRIQLINDFGPRKIFENELGADVLAAFISEKVKLINNDSKVSDRIANNNDNTEAGAKAFILSWIKNNYDKNKFASSIITKACFSEDIVVGDVSGTCLPKTIYYKDALEPRFSCNILIDNETECLKILNDLASVFRGLTYYKNNFITATIDVDKPISYLFNNSNVKNGTFVYSSGSIDGNYTVAKVLFRDKFQNYDQQVEIVEDSMLINSYGIVTKEILGFGITSRDQARRIGEWMLLTNRFENQTITFSTDIQGLLLKPSDIIEIQDQNKNDSILQGRVTSVNYDEKYITVDRKLNLKSTGQKIRFIADIQTTTIDTLNSLSTVSDNDIASLGTGSVIELKIDRIENNTNSVYFDETYNFDSFNKIISSTPFIIENSTSNDSKILYKIVSIAEVDNNEYSLFCIKHDKAKYEALSTNAFQKKTTFVDNTISYADSDTLKEVNLSGMYENGTATYYNIAGYSVNQINSIPVDYTFSEPQTSLIYNSQKDYYILTLDFPRIFSFIHNKSINGNDSEKEYYSYIQEVLNKKGGFLCKITLRNQCLTFKVSIDTINTKRIFLGKFGNNKTIVSANSGIRIYLYDQENKIIEV